MPCAIQIFSDTHLEFAKARPPKISDRADIIVIAGDVHVAPIAVRWFFETIRKKTKAPIVYVIGNHEYYRQVFPIVAQEYVDLENYIPDLHVLDRGSIVIKGIQFLGCTMWSRISKEAEAIVQYSINDCTLIEKGHGYLWSPKDSTRVCEGSTKWLVEELSKDFRRPIIVVTHHAPSEKSVAAQYKGDPLKEKMNESFYTNQEDIIKEFQPLLWIHGHMHHKVSYNIDNTLVVCNPKGYPHEYNRNGFIEELLVNLSDYCAVIDC